MSLGQRQAIYAWEERPLDVDPSAVWIIAGDLARLDEWAPTTATVWEGDLPEVGESFTTSIRVLGRHRAIRCEVAEWQAGRRFHLKLDGLPMSETADIECRVESIVGPEGPGATVALGYAAVVTSWVANLVRLGARRRVRGALRALGELAGSR